MDTVAHETTDNKKTPGPVASSERTWPLDERALAERREQLQRELDAVAQKRDALRSEVLRLAEVKALIDATDLGQEMRALKDSIKDLENVIDTMGCNIEWLSREVITGRTKEPQTTIPGTTPPKAPKAPKPSAAARTVPLLPEHSDPSATLPPAPAPLALPPAAHADAIDVEIVDEAAEQRERETWRGLVLDALGEEGPLPFAPLWAEVDGGCYEKGVEAPDATQLKALLSTMAGSGAVLVDEQERYHLPTPPKGSKKKPAKKAAPKAKPQPKKPAKVEKKDKGTKALWKPGRPGFVSSLTPEGTRRVLELLRAAPEQRMLESEVIAALDLPSDCHHPTGCYGGTWWGISDYSRVHPATKGKKTSKKAKVEAVEAPAHAPPPDERNEHGERLWRRPLQNWLHARLVAAGPDGVSYLDLCDEIEPTNYLFDELGAVADLLVVAGLATREKREGRDRRGAKVLRSVYMAAADEHGRSVDEAVRDEMAGTLADGPQTVEALACCLEVPQWVLLDVLQELVEVGRVQRLADGDWALATPRAEAAE